MKILNLAMANIRKSKSASVSLFIFILIAALLLNIGLMGITQINPFFDHKAEELNDPHVVFVTDQESYDPSYEDFLINYPGVIRTETEEIINMDIVKFNFGKGELSNSAIFYNVDNYRMIGPLSIIEKRSTVSAHDIFVPYSFKTDGDYELGDNFTIHYQGKEYKYQIAGFFETTMLATNNIGVMKFMLPETSYGALADELDNKSKALSVSAVMEDPTQSSGLKNDFIQHVQQLTEGQTTHYIWGLDIDLVKNVNTITINIGATILVAFATIIVLVSLIVIGFRVSNSIEDGMANIGILKAIGYTSGQILSSIILHFILIAFSASVVGVALSYVLMPFLGSVISTLSGLEWMQSFDLNMNLVSAFLVVFCVVIVTLLSAFRVRKILPVTALRGGIQTHSFRKNYFPLETAKGGIHFLLAIKSMLANVKQNIMILFIIIGVTFASIFSVVLYYNIAWDNTAFINLFGTEPANVIVVANSDGDRREFQSELEQMDHVRKVNLFDLIKTKVDGQNVYTNVTDDYNQLENNIVYEGRHPKHENEISISWVISSQINKGIGDTVEVEYGNEKAKFLVTGISQAIGNSGQVGAITLEGIQQLQSDYKGSSYYAYLDGLSNKDFIKDVEGQFGNDIGETVDINENIESQTGMYIAAVYAIMLMILIITVIVVVMILYLVIKTMIIKRKKEFGVMKAIGYSTVQLMNQISISFLPVIITGVACGGVLGLLFTNPLLSVLLSGAGVHRLDFIIHFPTILMLCVGIIILAYAVSMLVALRIKKISAYGLITE